MVKYRRILLVSYYKDGNAWNVVELVSEKS